MASKQRFRTLGRDENRLGRLAIDFEYRKANSILTIFLGEAKNLALPLDTGELTGITPSTYLHARLQLLPHRNTPQVATSLFAMGPPKVNEFRKITRLHRETQNPQFDETFDFDLREFTEDYSLFRVYISVMASIPVATDGSGFLGCMSFGLQDLVATSHEEMPRWYWLLSKTQGLSRFKPVEHSLAGTPAANENVVRIDGRKLGASNAHINGYYSQQPQLFAGRHTYKHDENSLILYFHPARGVWAIGDSVGNSAPYAYIESDVYNANQLRGSWYVYSVGREFITTAGTSKQGRYEVDPGVACYPLVPEPDRPYVERNTQKRVSNIPPAWAEPNRASGFSQYSAESAMVPQAGGRPQSGYGDQDYSQSGVTSRGQGSQRAKRSRSVSGAPTRNLKHPVWLHEDMSKVDAEALLESLPDGTFFVRERSGKPTEFVLAVVFRGKPTHHLMRKDEETGAFLINNRVYGKPMETLVGAIDALRVPQPDWPMSLTEFVTREGATKKEVELEIEFARMLVQSQTGEQDQAMRALTSAVNQWST